MKVLCVKLVSGSTLAGTPGFDSKLAAGQKALMMVGGKLVKKVRWNHMGVVEV